MATFHIIGAGLSGLAAAVSLCAPDRRVCVYESTSQAGGRCRSFIDPVLGREIDNGNHLLIGANAHSWAYVDRMNSRSALHCPHPYYDFIDLNSGKTSRLKAPFWMPATPLVDLLRMAQMMMAGKSKTVSHYFSANSAIYREFIEPFCISALNTAPHEASARLFGNVLRRGLLHKGKLEPYVPTHSWQHALIDPAINYIQQSGGGFYYQHALKQLVVEDQTIRELQFGRTSITVAAGDVVILATPFAATAALCPDIGVPHEYSPILNGHFICDHGQPNGTLLGIIGGTAQWLFFKDGMISTTTSAAEEHLETNQDNLAELLWQDVCAATNRSDALPECRIIMEKRATFKATPHNQLQRPNAATAFHNLFLAGDYLNTGLPACIEGAITSGHKAAALAIATVSH